ncbi:unnamed protein product [Clonostachys rosea]|uniref:Major facilitator superfamily (MFS) profile domain-containing protein n=1 Tax=Bionectria ochroleuca TaxID=29856 RepID=A0ABY6U3Z4_BIOOC|nr:unnamed protein product [Clonostachys rosea]
MSPSVPSTDFIPGTVHLVDLDGTLNYQHSKGVNHDVVLIPTPSTDPDDPLNWSPKRKLLFLSCLCVYCLAIGIASAAIYSILVPISTVTNLTVADLNSGIGYMFLMLGWGCLVWQPLAQKFGKRPVYLASLLGTMAIMLWAPYASTQGQWIANKVIQGFFGAPIESLCEISVADVWFTHERGTYISFYALFVAGSNFLAPIISGFINDGQGWQWVLHWCAIFNGAAFIILFFLMEETKYTRAALATEHHVPDDGIVTTNNDHIQKDAIGSEQKANAPLAAEIIGQGHIEWQPKSFWAKLRIVRREDLRESVPLRGMVIRPFLYFKFPIIVFAGFMYGAVICYFNVLNGTVSLILSASPYDFSPSIVGLSYVSCLVGVFLGAFSAGPLGDKFILWKARCNNGIMEPEHRLWIYTALLVLTPGGLLLWGVGAAQEVHWFGLVFAMGSLGASITIGSQLPLAYCIDCYKDLGADAIVTVILIRNTMSFAVSYGITPWVTNMGYRNTFLVAAFAALLQLSVSLVFIKWGRNLRKASVSNYWKYVKQVKADGLIH